MVCQQITCRNNRSHTATHTLIEDDMNKNPFDLLKLDDLPESIKTELRVYRIDRVEKNILDLFEIAQRPLNLDEIMVGYFRQYNETLSRKQWMTKLYNMARAEFPLIKSVKGRKGVYEAI